MGIEDKLTGALFRIDCPDSVELGEYNFGTLDEARTTWIDDHLTICPHCAGEMVSLRAYLQDVNSDLDYSLADRVKIVIARLIPDPTDSTSGLQPAYAVRGRDVAPLMYEAGDLQISIEVAAEEGRPTPKTMVGLVIGDAMTDAPVNLWPVDGTADTPAASAIIDDIGGFVLPEVPAGTYDLVLRNEDTEIHIQSLEVS